ncbi:MAG: hypothetical protein J5I90_12880 [Caldilineales bacterium]|nr:hypothetical protein [Caldilineales bacterium]
MNVPISLRVAAAISWLFAFGLGIPCLMAIRNLAIGRGIPLVFGFPAYGGGAFERHGLPTTVLLLVGFLLISILELIAGYLLWGGYRSGAILAIVLLVPGAVYWWGFDLPFPPIAAVIQTILIILGWSSFI